VSTLSFKVAAYPDCAEDLIQFRNHNREIERDRAYFDWRYLERPCVARPIIVWCSRGEEPVGALTVFPHDYYVMDCEYAVGVLGDISVRAHARGQGIAGAMFKFLHQANEMRALYGGLVLPNVQAAGALAKSGWREVTRVERFVKPLDVTVRFGGWLGGRGARLLAAPVNQALRCLSQEVFSRSGGHQRGALVDDIDERFTDLWRRSDKSGKVIGVRDARYLQWRYQRHPLNRYRVFALTEGELLVGYAAYRVADGISYVDDIFYDVQRCRPERLLVALLGHFRELRMATVWVNVNNSAWCFPWRGFGFLRRSDYQAVMVSSGATANAWSGVPAKVWHMTAGDKDV
jgi:GNAT superfamily N-acetyltransferase